MKIIESSNETFRAPAGYVLLSDAEWQAWQELLRAANDTLPVFDGLTDQAWKVYRGYDRKELLRAAIAAVEAYEAQTK